MKDRASGLVMRQRGGDNDSSSSSARMPPSLADLRDYRPLASSVPFDWFLPVMPHVVENPASRVINS